MKSLIKLTEGDLHRIIKESIVNLLNEQELGVGKKIRIEADDYIFNVNVKFGSLNDMIDNSTRNESMAGGYCYVIGGNFNRAMLNLPTRKNQAPFIQIAVVLDRENNGATSININSWKAVYSKNHYFDEELKNGLYPVEINWDGKTYVRGLEDRGEYNWHKGFN